MIFFCSGNYYLLFRSTDFWFCFLLTTCLALLPRYLFKSVKFIFFPNDFDILRWIKKTDAKRNFAEDPALGGKLKARHDGHLDDIVEDDTASMSSSFRPPRRSFQSSRRNLHHAHDWRSGSRTDMSTGQLVANRGFDFSTEEGGIAIRRTQTNLSERYLSRMSASRTNTHPYMASAPTLPREPSNKRSSLNALVTFRKSLRKPKEDESP
jgi:phospholipid-translocating ATPase